MTPVEHDAAAARQRAAALVGALGGGAGEPGERLGAAMPVRSPAGELDSWFVPVLAGHVLRGYVQLAADLTLQRRSTFGAETDQALWTDPETVLRTAATALEPGESTETPFLSYDRSPARLAWAVPTRGPGGRRGLVFVAGAFAWRAV